jgi:hypothetical protein
LVELDFDGDLARPVDLDGIDREDGLGGTVLRDLPLGAVAPGRVGDRIVGGEAQCNQRRSTQPRCWITPSGVQPRL